MDDQLPIPLSCARCLSCWHHGCCALEGEPGYEDCDGWEEEREALKDRRDER